MVSKDMIESKARDVVKDLNKMLMRHDSGILKEVEAIIQRHGFGIEYSIHTLEIVYNICKGKVREIETCVLDCLFVYDFSYAKVRFEFDNYKWKYEIDFDGCDDREEVGYEERQ